MTVKGRRTTVNHLWSQLLVKGQGREKRKVILDRLSFSSVEFSAGCLGLNDITVDNQSGLLLVGGRLSSQWLHSVAALTCSVSNTKETISDSVTTIHYPMLVSSHDR